MVTEELKEQLKKVKRKSPYRFAIKDFQTWLENDTVLYDISLLEPERMKERILAFYSHICKENTYFSERFCKGALLCLCKKYNIPLSALAEDGLIFTEDDEQQLVEEWPALCKNYLNARKKDQHKPDIENSPIPLKPKVCNICGGKVIFVSNSLIYGKEYGSGKCYLCMKCQSFVGTHKPWPNIALGILANKPMREGKKYCHALFDPLWQNQKKKKTLKRNALYKWLTKEMGLPENMGHFGYFDLTQLRQAYRILKKVEGKTPVFSQDNSEVIEFVQSQA